MFSNFKEKKKNYVMNNYLDKLRNNLLFPNKNYYSFNIYLNKLKNNLFLNNKNNKIIRSFQKFLNLDYLSLYRNYGFVNYEYIHSVRYNLKYDPHRMVFELIDKKRIIYLKSYNSLINNSSKGFFLSISGVNLNKVFIPSYNRLSTSYMLSHLNFIRKKNLCLLFINFRSNYLSLINTQRYGFNNNINSKNLYVILNLNFYKNYLNYMKLIRNFYLKQNKLNEFYLYNLTLKKNYYSFVKFNNNKFFFNFYYLSKSLYFLLKFFEDIFDLSVYSFLSKDELFIKFIEFKFYLNILENRFFLLLKNDNFLINLFISIPLIFYKFFLFFIKSLYIIKDFFYSLTSFIFYHYKFLNIKNLRQIFLFFNFYYYYKFNDFPTIKNLKNYIILKNYHFLEKTELLSYLDIDFSNTIFKFITSNLKLLLEKENIFFSYFVRYYLNFLDYRTSVFIANICNFKFFFLKYFVII